MKTILIIIGVILLFFLIFANIRFEIRKTDTIYENQKFNRGKHVSLIDQGNILIKAQWE